MVHRIVGRGLLVAEHEATVRFFKELQFNDIVVGVVRRIIPLYFTRQIYQIWYKYIYSAMEFNQKNQEFYPPEKFNLNQYLEQPNNLVLPLMLNLLNEKIEHEASKKTSSLLPKLPFFGWSEYNHSISSLIQIGWNRHNHSIRPLVQNYHQALLALDQKFLLIYEPHKRQPDLPKKQLVNGVLSASILFYDMFAVFERDSLIPYLPIDSDILTDIASNIDQVCSAKLNQYNHNNYVDSPHLKQSTVEANNIHRFCLVSFTEYLQTKVV